MSSEISQGPDTPIVSPNSLQDIETFNARRRILAALLLHCSTFTAQLKSIRTQSAGYVFENDIAGLEASTLRLNRDIRRAIVYLWLQGR